jgi:hypothetical protein
LFKFGVNWTEPIYNGGCAVPILLGFILGVIVTIGGAYEYDLNSGRYGNGLSVTDASGNAPMVNWNVVDNQWQIFQSNVRATAADLEHKLKAHTG